MNKNEFGGIKYHFYDGGTKGSDFTEQVRGCTDPKYLGRSLYS